MVAFHWMLVKERLSAGQWVPPWLRYQHEARYLWSSRFVGGRHVLDAACGNAYGSSVLARGGAAAVVALDIAMEALWDGRRAGQSMTMVNGSATALPFAEGTFDLFVSLETIEHVADDTAYVAEAGRVLKDCGILICSTPNRRVLNPGRSIRQRPFNPFHLREYAPDEFEALLQTQFPQIRLYGQSAYAHRYVSLLARIGTWAPMAAVRLHQMRKLAGIPLERRARHEPRPLPFHNGEPEVLIAVCSRSTEAVQ